MTRDQRALGCYQLGLKGALRYDDRSTMIATWHDANEAIPTDAAIQTAADAYAAANPVIANPAQAEADRQATRTTLTDAVPVMTQYIADIDAGTINSLAKTLPILKLLLRVARAIIKRL
jgi:hypothetical protein